MAGYRFKNSIPETHITAHHVRINSRKPNSSTLVKKKAKMCTNPNHLPMDLQTTRPISHSTTIRVDSLIQKIYKIWKYIMILINFLHLYNPSDTIVITLSSPNQPHTASKIQFTHFDTTVWGILPPTGNYQQNIISCLSPVGPNLQHGKNITNILV